MKTKKYLLVCLVAIMSAIVGGCSSDSKTYTDVDGLPPVLSLTSQTIRTEPGRDILIEGRIEDADGIRSINLYNEDLMLDKTIDLLSIYDELLFSYDLKYKFTIDKSFSADAVDLKITVTDVGGRSVESVLRISMDGDFTAPVFTSSPDAAVTVLIKSETTINVKFTVEDDKQLDYATVDIEELGYSQRLEASGKTLSFNEKIVVESVPGTYTLIIEAFDKFEHKTVKKSVFTVSEMPDFPKMYLADVTTAAELNSDVFGVPMRIERTAPYKYKANYYNSKANTPIFFLPQKSDFSPICFGLDPDDNQKLTDSPELAKPIILTQANVYYEIVFDIKESTYSISTYSIAEAISPVPHEYGSISLDTWGDGGSWLQEFYFGLTSSGPGNIQRFVQDAVNPNLFTLQEPLELKGGDKMNFIIHNWHSHGWWNYCTWRVDDSDNPEIFGYYGNVVNPLWTGTKTAKDNWAKPTVGQSGTYQFYFDAHLERAKLVRK